MPRMLSVLFLSTLTCVAGCGDGTATVSGQVSYRGRPVTSGSIIMVNPDGTAESGVIQPDATYSVDGVQKGRVKIGVLSPDPAHARSILRADENRAKANRKHTKAKAPVRAKDVAWFPLPHDLGDPAKSGLECDVTASRVNYDITVK